jgi:hypothetical protein
VKQDLYNRQKSRANKIGNPLRYSRYQSLNRHRQSVNPHNTNKHNCTPLHTQPTSNMRLSTSPLAIVAALLPAVHGFPTSEPFKVPTCASEQCLTTTNGRFDDCKTDDLVCLCDLEQTEVTRYVSTVQPCIDGKAGHNACTGGAIWCQFSHLSI